VPRRATSRIGTIGQRPVKTAPAPLRVLPRCKSSECGHLQTPYGRPFHSELGAHGWSRYGAPWSEQVASGKSAGSRNRKNKRIPLPLAATGCVGKYMVSRASAVGCHPSREVPSLRGRGSTRQWRVGPERYFLLQSGHGHCSHPRPVHASRITQRLYRRSRARLRASSTSRPPR